MDDALEHLPNDALLATVRRLTARSNVALADLLAHLGEVERRGIHRERACASLFTYCVCELRMSEDAAFRRAKAARLVRRYPEVRDAIAKGEIHLTGLLMIAPYLGGEHHEDVLRRSRFRSKRELCRLIAEIDPKPAVPALVEPLGPAPAGRAGYAAHIESLTGAVRAPRSPMFSSARSSSSSRSSGRNAAASGATRRRSRPNAPRRRGRRHRDAPLPARTSPRR